jgi:hypothetical protein
MFKKLIYWIRYGVSEPFLWIGFRIDDLGALIVRGGVFIQRFGNKLQDLAVAIEGEVPEGCEEKR